MSKEQHRTPEEQAHIDRWNAFSARFDAWLATHPDPVHVEHVLAQAATMHDPNDAIEALLQSLRKEE